MDENTYLITENGIGVLIDPGSSAEDVIKFAGDINIKYIFLTHCHYDHIKGVEKLREITGAELCVTEECAGNIKNPNVKSIMMCL